MRNLDDHLDRLVDYGSDEYHSYPEEFRQRALDSFRNTSYDRDKIGLLIDPHKRKLISGHNHQDLFKNLELTNLYLDNLINRIYPEFQGEFREYFCILIDKILLTYPGELLFNKIFAFQCPLILTDNSLYEGVFTVIVEHLYASDLKGKAPYTLAPAYIVIEIEITKALRMPAPFRHAIAPTIADSDLSEIINKEMRRSCYPNRTKRHYSDVYSILTNRQREVAQFKAQGFKDKEIASQLGITHRRVREIWIEVKRRCKDKADYAMNFQNENLATIQYLQYIELIDSLWKEDVGY